MGINHDHDPTDLHRQVLALIDGDVEEGPVLHDLLERIGSSSDAQRLLLSELALTRMVSAAGAAVAPSTELDRTVLKSAGLGLSGAASAPNPSGRGFYPLLAGILALCLTGIGYLLHPLLSPSDGNDHASILSSPEVTALAPESLSQHAPTPSPLQTGSDVHNESASVASATRPSSTAPSRSRSSMASPRSTPARRSAESTPTRVHVRPDGALVSGERSLLSWQGGRLDDIVQYRPDGSSDWRTIGRAEGGKIVWDVPAIESTSNHLSFRRVEAAVSTDGMRPIDPFENDTTLNLGSLSRDGAEAALSDWSGKVRVVDVAAGIAVEEYQPHTASVIEVRFSPDGRYLLSTSLDGTVLLWDREEQREVYRVGGRGKVAQVAWTIAWHPSGERFATGHDDGSISVHDAADGTELLRIDAHREAIRDMHYSVDGDWIVSASTDGRASAFDAGSGANISYTPMHRHVVNGVTISSDRSLLMTASYDGTIRFFRAADGSMLDSVDLGAGVRPSKLQISPDDRWLVVGTHGRESRLFDPWSATEIGRIPFDDPNPAGAWPVFSRDGSRLAILRGSQILFRDVTQPRITTNPKRYSLAARR